MSQSSEEMAQQFISQFQGGSIGAKLESFGYFLDNYVIAGGVLTPDSYDNRKVSFAEATISFANALFQVDAKSFHVSIASATYFLDFTSAGLVFNITHPVGEYLPLWQVNTNSSGLVSSIVDMRGEMGYVRFRSEIQGIITDAVIVDDTHIAPNAVTEPKIANSSVSSRTLQDASVQNKHLAGEVTGRINTIEQKQTTQGNALTTQAGLINALQTGDSGPAANAARMNSVTGITHSTLKMRLDTEYSELAAIPKQNINPKGRTSVRPMITFFSDDGKIDDYTVLKDIGVAKGIGFTTAIVTSWVGTSGYCSKAQLLELQNSYGWEIVSHTNTHSNLTTLTESQVDDEFRISSEYLKNNGFSGRTIAIPYGAAGDREKRIAQKYFRGLRSSDSVYNVSPIETFGLRSLWITNDPTVSTETGFAKNTLEHYKFYIDRAATQNGWIVLSTHSWEISEWGYQTLLGQIIDYAKTKADIVSMNQALDRLDNIFDSVSFNKSDPYKPHFVVSTEGVVDTHYAMTITKPVNSVLSTDLPSSFEPRSITICNINSSSTGFPDKPGLVTTYAIAPAGLTNYGYYYQTVKSYDKAIMNIRTGKDNNTWDSWVEMFVPDYKIASMPTLAVAHTPADLKDKNIIMCTYNNAGAVGMPENKAGTLLGYAFPYTSDKTWYYETYRIRGTNTTYTRYAVNDTTWSAWFNPLDPLNFVTVTYPRGTFTGDTLPQDFIKGKIIKTSVLANTSNMPSTSTGALTIDTTGLTTGGSSDWGYVAQVYEKYGSNEIWRRWAASGTTWSAWGKLTIV